MSVASVYHWPSNDKGVALFALRRPDWQLPDLDQVHQGLRLTGVGEHTHEIMGRRVPCPKCGKTRAVFCYDCRERLESCIPTVRLPFTFNIVTHYAEPAAKNTGVHAAILAEPGQVELHDVEHCPEFDKETAVVLYPCDEAVTVEQLEPGSVRRAFVIDSRWQKAQELLRRPALTGVRRVKLTHTRSAFWRHHTRSVSEEGVCTVECMLHFIRAMLLHGKLAPDQLPPSALAPAPAPPLAAPPPTTEQQQQQQRQPEPRQPEPATSRRGAGADTGGAQQGGAEEQAPEGNGGGAAPVADAGGAPQERDEEGGGGDGGDAADGPGSVSCTAEHCTHAPGWHAWDDLLWIFTLQHRHIQDIAQRRLQQRIERKAAREQEGEGGGGGGGGGGAGKRKRPKGRSATAAGAVGAGGAESSEGGTGAGEREAPAEEEDGAS